MARIELAVNAEYGRVEPGHELRPVLLDRKSGGFLGSGEATQGPTPAPVANAAFGAWGVRLRAIPFHAGRVRAATGR